MSREFYEKQPAVCNCVNLRRASLAITEVYDDYLSPSGLKNGQFSMLNHIKSLSPVNVSELALKIRLDRTTLVRNLKLLEQRGLIADTAPKGSRNRQLVVTELGEQTLDIASRNWLEAQSFMEAYMGKEALTTLTALLSKIEALVP